jgi:hypothetical protein
MHRAGDWITVTDGALKGQTFEIASVRMFATDNGYWVKGADGLLPPNQVALARERAGGNPCGTDCTKHKHDLIGTCDHCRGVCLCRYRRA